jgi:hypothetical protein
MPSADLHEHLNALTRLIANDSEGEAFHVASGALKGFAAATPEILAHVKAAIALHRNARRVETAAPSRQTFGIEIGAGVAKLFVKAWPQGAAAQAIVDVKLRLPKRTGTPETDRAYRGRIEDILATFAGGATNACLIPPQAIDLDAPQKLRDACPPNTNVIYVYGTQGPRDSTRQSGPLFPGTLRTLTGDEEARLLFDAIVPQDARHPGAMAIEIGTGSTELALIDAAGRTHAIAFAVGAGKPEALGHVARALETGDIEHAADHLESPTRSAATFIAAAHSAKTARTLFINPNKDSAAMRAHAKDKAGALPTEAVARYASEHPTAPFAVKAKILATIAKALGHTAVREGNKGGLKEGMAQFVGRALTPPSPSA